MFLVFPCVCPLSLYTSPLLFSSAPSSSDSGTSPSSRSSKFSLYGFLFPWTSLTPLDWCGFSSSSVLTSPSSHCKFNMCRFVFQNRRYSSEQESSIVQKGQKKPTSRRLIDDFTQMKLRSAYT